MWSGDVAVLFEVGGLLGRDAGLITGGVSRLQKLRISVRTKSNYLLLRTHISTPSILDYIPPVSTLRLPAPAWACHTHTF